MKKQLQQFDNRNSGALFPTPKKDVLEGPYTLEDNKPARIRLTLKGEGKPYELEVFKAGKDGKAIGKPIGIGNATRNPNADQLSANGNLPPVARGTITFKKGKDVPQNIWRAVNTTDGSKFYQVKPNTGANRDVPDLI